LDANFENITLQNEVVPLNQENNASKPSNIKSSKGRTRKISTKMM